MTVLMLTEGQETTSKLNIHNAIIGAVMSFVICLKKINVLS